MLLLRIIITHHAFAASYIIITHTRIHLHQIGAATKINIHTITRSQKHLLNTTSLHGISSRNHNTSTKHIYNKTKTLSPTSLSQQSTYLVRNCAANNTTYHRITHHYTTTRVSVFVYTYFAQIITTAFRFIYFVPSMRFVIHHSTLSTRYQRIINKLLHCQIESHSIIYFYKLYLRIVTQIIIILLSILLRHNTQYDFILFSIRVESNHGWRIGHSR